MTNYMEITEALEISRTAANLGDRATCIEGLERSAGVAAVQARLLGAGSNECEDCGCEIPLLRREAVPGVRLCIDCQEVEERRHG